MHNIRMCEDTRPTKFCFLDGLLVVKGILSVQYFSIWHLAVLHLVVILPEPIKRKMTDHTIISVCQVFRSRVPLFSNTVQYCIDKIQVIRHTWVIIFLTLPHLNILFFFLFFFAGSHAENFWN